MVIDTPPVWKFAEVSVGYVIVPKAVWDAFAAKVAPESGIKTARFFSLSV